MMRYLSILQCEAEKVCGVNYLKYYNIKKPPHSQQIQRRVMPLNSFFAEKLLSHGVASVVGYYRQVLLLCMLKKSFNLSIYTHCVGRCLSQVLDKLLVSCLETTDHNKIMVTKGVCYIIRKYVLILVLAKLFEADALLELFNDINAHWTLMIISIDIVY